MMRSNCSAGLHELPGGFLVQLLRDDMSPAQRAEIALHPVTFLRRLGQVEVAGVFQVRTLVEVTLKGAAQENSCRPSEAPACSVP